MVIKTCSFRLKGPGFSEKDQLVNGTRIALVGRVAAINFPIGRTRICADTDETYSWFWRYPKNWFTKARTAHEIIPRNHVRKVKAGNEGSSVVGTVSLTCSIGLSSSSSFSASTKPQID